MRTLTRTSLWALAALAAGCSTGADSRESILADLRVADGQFYRGVPPAESGGPDVKALASTNNRVFPGLGSSNFSGNVVDTAQSVLIWLENDFGYWMIPTGVVDPVEEGQRTFGAKLGFARTVGPGKHVVQVRAVDAQGRIGKAKDFTYVVLDPTPQGALVISLDWDADADLDLRVTMPNPMPTAMEPTIEIGPKRPSSARSSMVPDGGADSTARIDVDSNAQCVIDGRRMENFVIKQAPPAGAYQVRVDTASLCGVPAARWHVRVLRDGTVIGEASGIASPYDGYPAQGEGLMFGKDQRPGTAGAGALAVEFTL
jgi:hypothetical protein